jgi:hypothetical protein
MASIHDFVRRGGWKINESSNRSGYPKGQVQLIAVDTRRSGTASVVWADERGDAVSLEEIPYEGGELVGIDRTGRYHVQIHLVKQDVLHGHVRKLGAIDNDAGMADDGLAGTWGADASGGKPEPKEEPEETRALATVAC